MMHCGAYMEVILRKADSRYVTSICNEPLHLFMWLLHLESLRGNLHRWRLEEVDETPFDPQIEPSQLAPPLTQTQSRVGYVPSASNYNSPKASRKKPKTASGRIADLVEMHMLKKDEAKEAFSVKKCMDLITQI